MKPYKNIFSFIVLVLISAGCNQTAEIGFDPVNPKASTEARQLLQFLYSIQGEYTLTGQHNFVSDLKRYDNVVHEITGKYPIVWGSDFSFMAQGDSVRNYQHCGPMNLTVPYDSCVFNGRSAKELRQGLVDEVKRKHAEGRIITLMWHCCYPTEGDECDGASIWRWVQGLPSAEEWQELVTDGTPLNTAWKQQMDGIIPYLRSVIF